MTKELDRRIAVLEQRYGETDEVFVIEGVTIRASELRRVIYGNAGQRTQDIINAEDNAP